MSSSSVILITHPIFNKEDSRDPYMYLVDADPDNNTLYDNIRKTLDSKLLDIINYMRLANSDTFTLLTSSKSGSIYEYEVTKLPNNSYYIHSLAKPGDKCHGQTATYNVVFREEPVMVPIELRTILEHFVESKKEQQLFNYHKNGYRIYRKDGHIFVENIITGYTGKVVKVKI